MRFARIALACGFLCSTESARDMEHMSTGSGHAYNEYRSYGSGLVANFFPDASRHSQHPTGSSDRASPDTHSARLSCGVTARTDLTAAWAAASTALLTACGDQ